MAFFHKSDDFEPMGWVRGYPIYGTTLLVLSHIATLLLTTIVAATHVEWLYSVMFSNAAVLHQYSVWQLVTYPWVHLMGRPVDPLGLLFFVMEMAMLYTCGREVERFIGRRSFLLLYFCLVITPSLLLTACGFWFNVSLSGSFPVHLAIFVAFATLYPSVQLSFNISAKWMAWILLGISTILNSFSGMVALWIDAAAAWYFINWNRGTAPELFGFLHRPAPKTSEPAPPRRPTPPKKLDKPVPNDPVAAIDPLLEKIAKHGMASLTPQERAQLQRARQELLARPKR